MVKLYSDLYPWVGIAFINSCDALNGIMAVLSIFVTRPLVNSNSEKIFLRRLRFDSMAAILTLPLSAKAAKQFENKFSGP